MFHMPALFLVIGSIIAADSASINDGFCNQRSGIPTTTSVCICQMATHCGKRCFSNQERDWILEINSNHNRIRLYLRTSTQPLESHFSQNAWWLIQKRDCSMRRTITLTLELKQSRQLHANVAVDFETNVSTRLFERYKLSVAALFQRLPL